MTQLQLPQQRTSRPTRVLIVDDDPTRRYVSAELLRAEGYEVLSASGHEGVLALFATSLSKPAAWVSFVAAHKPDIVIVDLAMKTGDPLITVGAITRHPLTMHLPVLAIGHRAQKKEIDMAASMGASTGVTWPVGLEGLSPHIEHAMKA